MYKDLLYSCLGHNRVGKRERCSEENSEEDERRRGEEIGKCQEGDRKVGRGMNQS